MKNVWLAFVVVLGVGCGDASRDPQPEAAAEQSALTKGAALSYDCTSTEGICSCSDFLDCLAMAHECVPTTFDCPWQLSVCYCIDEIVGAPPPPKDSPKEPLPPGAGEIKQ